MASMSTDNLQVINVNGLNKNVPINKSAGVSTDWRDLENWLKDQENFFNQNKIRTDKEKIQHVIMNIDCRHWSKLDNFFKFNQQSELSYEMMKKVLIKKVKRILDPTMAKYDEKVDGYIDKLNITKIDYDNLKAWLKTLRCLCDGQAKDEYLTIKILSRVHTSKKQRVCSNLVREIKADIELYESRIKATGSKMGKGKGKELERWKKIENTIKTFID